MYNILTLDNIAQKGLDKLPAEQFTAATKIDNPHAILVRSSKMHEMQFEDNLLCIARAGAGTNNIPIDRCTQNGIAVFNTPGANANAVKELSLAGLILASRKIAQGIIWAKGLEGDVNAQVEKGKKAFAGPEIAGKVLGVIGLGAIGVMVANAALELGMEVIGYDPYLNVEGAWHLSSRVIRATELDELTAKCDYITLHLPANQTTEKMVNAAFIAKCKDNVRIINYARGELINTTDIKAALECGKVAAYVADFPTVELLDTPNAVFTPHLGASTPESEENCAVMAAKEVYDYLLYGNVVNSVNLPECVLPYTGKTRIAVINENIPNMVGTIANVFAKEAVNIDNMINKSRGEYAYTLIDVDNLNDKTEKLLNELNAVDGIIKVRIIKRG